MKTISVILSLLFSIASHAAVFNHMGTCRNTLDTVQTPLRIFQGEDESKGLIVIEFPDPETNNKSISVESVTLKKINYTNYTVIFEKDSLLKQLSETDEFQIKAYTKQKWVGKYQTYECLLGDELDRKEIFDLAKKIHGSRTEDDKEIANMGPYRCEKTNINFLPGFDGGKLDPMELYTCSYETNN